MAIFKRVKEALLSSGGIGKDEIRQASETLRLYKDGKTNLDARIVENEEWWKMRHWPQITSSKNTKDPEPASAWLVNSIMNKHADAMDNSPIPTCLPRAQDDEEDAKVLSKILPVILDQNEYEQTYSDLWWYKLKTGVGVTGVFWNKNKNNGLGDVDIKRIDILNLFWQPGITDIQKSRNVFSVELIDNDVLEEQYPQLVGKTGRSVLSPKEYIYDDTVDVSKKSLVIDWYYKVNVEGKDILHYCKFCNDEVLYSSESDPVYKDRGFYDHGKYPFVFDVLFPEEGTPTGFGYLDICKDAQMYIDKLNQVILKNSIMAGRPRWFIRGDGGINETEYANWETDFVHYVGSGTLDDNIQQIRVNTLPEVYVAVLNGKIEELKETSGNRDFSQGSTANGVTAASAIAALQEAGSKLSRDMNKSAYRATTKTCYLVIELIRQFYDEPRQFRIIGDSGGQEFVSFSNRNIRMQGQGADFGLDMGYRMPIFDIKVASQKSSPFSTMAQNERAKELYGMGFFNPELADQALIALDMMDFEGIDKVRAKISENVSLMQQMQLLQGQMMDMAQIIDTQNGTTIAQGMMQESQESGTSRDQGSGKREAATNSLGDVIRDPRSGTAGVARAKVAQTTVPK